ncbi:DUF3040 domain-containing protein [Cellulomonas carbonis]|uniref:DUF3040 domain-containing protein n=1 Tax=Cellulomonas carbonis T26 TaxID=947969 RepID=A0A0A0BVW1_9CELL|nr:DUF3040 domain-containing protein [Cellulomonas carbonis]KGM12115.1 hypothetical protein N868_01715 [Cellulomonas carbonis T26]GGB97134.1 membrane protein [Cellulomonas carbonis]
MPLSEYEQRVLEQMERQLSSDDPKLVNTFQGRASSGLRRWVLVGLGAVVGLTVLVVGAATSNPIVGVLGFIVMFVSAVLAFSPPRRSGPTGVVGPDGTVRRPGTAPKPSRNQSFVQRMEARWERRRDERGR